MQNVMAEQQAYSDNSLLLDAREQNGWLKYRNPLVCHAAVIPQTAAFPVKILRHSAGKFLCQRLTNQRDKNVNAMRDQRIVEVVSGMMQRLAGCKCGTWRAIAISTLSAASGC